MNKILILLKKLALIALPVFLLHTLIFQLDSLCELQENFQYQIWSLYIVSIVFSVLNIILMQKVSERNFESTGFVYIVVLTIKMAVFYFLLQPILNNSTENNIEKINFGLIVFLFLIIDIILASKILNKKHPLNGN